MNTTHPFGHFCFTDFRETGQEYVNPCASESSLAKFWFFSVKGSKTWFFGSFGELWGQIQLTTVRRRKTLTKQRHILCMSSVEQHQSDHPKTYPLHVDAGDRWRPHFANCRNRHARAGLIRHVTRNMGQSPTWGRPGCAYRKPWSISSACKNLRGQHPLRAEIYSLPKNSTWVRQSFVTLYSH